jgi:hypothetical protein
MKCTISAKKNWSNNCSQQQKCARREVAITGEGVTVKTLKTHKN